MSKKLLVLLFFFFFILSLGIVAQEEKESEKLPEEYKVIIRGRLLYEDKSPVADKEVQLWGVKKKGEEFQVTQRYSDKGKLLNPIVDTDSSGNFTIVADRRLWKESGKFVLSARIYYDITYITDSNNILRLFEVDESIKKIEVGDITVKY